MFDLMIASCVPTAQLFSINNAFRLILQTTNFRHTIWPTLISCYAMLTKCSFYVQHTFTYRCTATHTHTDCQMGCVINRVCVCVYGGPFQFSFGDFSKNSLIWMWIDCEWGGILCSFSVLHFLFIARVRLFISWACVCVCMFGFYSPNTFNNI